MVIKITFRIKMIKNNSIIEFMEIITIKNKNRNNNKQTLREKTKINSSTSIIHFALKISPFERCLL